MALVFLTAQNVASAQDSSTCRQENAHYASEDGRYQLEFIATSASATTSNSFQLISKDPEIKLDGVVIWNQGFSRPNGILMHNCPEGDVTGDELDACTIWQGVIYALKENADADLLPAPDEPAAKALLLPDLGRAIHYSKLRHDGKIEQAPWDVFKFSKCQKK